MDAQEPQSKPDYLHFARAQQARFWAKGRRASSGCLEWTAGRDKDGYGKFCIELPRKDGKQQQKHIQAHRLSLELTRGSPLLELRALHHCDNPCCFEPTHLYAGTQKQNRADADRRGRSRNGRAKLTESQAREVLAQKRAGVPHADIARRFNVKPPTVSQVGTRNWKHIVTGGA